MRLKIVGTEAEQALMKELSALLIDHQNKETTTLEDKEVVSLIFKLFEDPEQNFPTSQEFDYLERNSKESWADYLIYRYKFRFYSEKNISSNFPLYLLIEPASVCNLKCRMCWHSDESFAANKDFLGFMDIDFFKNLIDQAVKGGTKALTMASRGEPSLHPRFPEMLEYCAGKFFEVKINTNAIRMNDKLIHSILKSGVHSVVFSIDHYTNEGYASIRMKDCLDVVVKNIKRFNEIREKKYPNSKTVTRIHGVKADKSLIEEEFFKYWEPICDQVSIGNCDQRWDIYNNETHKRKEACPILHNRMYVWHDGTCNPCDADYKSTLKLGNAKEESLQDIWNGHRFEELRNAHVSGKRSCISPCNGCDL